MAAEAVRPSSGPFLLVRLQVLALSHTQLHSLARLCLPTLFVQALQNGVRSAILVDWVNGLTRLDWSSA